MPASPIIGRLHGVCTKLEPLGPAWSPSLWQAGTCTGCRSQLPEGGEGSLETFTSGPTRSRAPQGALSPWQCDRAGAPRKRARARVC